MTASLSLPDEVVSYLGEVRAALADLPAEEREELMADVEASLLDAADEGGSLKDRLGPPASFAGELRQAAGLAPAATPPAAPAQEPSVLERLRALAGSARVRQAGAMARELAPVWWVARGYLAVALLGLVTGAAWYAPLPIVPRLGPPLVAVLLIVAAVVISVALGRREPGRPPRRGRLAVNVVLAATVLPLAVHVLNWEPQSQAVFYSAPAHAEQGIAHNGHPVSNIYPYSRDGELLLDVILYDQDGSPLSIETPAAQDPFRRRLLTSSGEEIANAFPIRYAEPGTTRVENPLATPAINPPEVVTPPLVEEPKRSERRRRSKR